MGKVHAMMSFQSGRNDKHKSEPKSESNKKNVEIVSFFNLNSKSDVVWAHAVNSKEFLDSVLKNNKKNNNDNDNNDDCKSIVHMIEADVGKIILEKTENGSKTKKIIAVMSHDEPTQDSFPLESFINNIIEHNNHAQNHLVGVKFDFKDPEAVQPTLEILKSLDQQQKLCKTPLWLNCDALHGPGGAEPRFNFETFVRQCEETLPNNHHLYSIGWTTGGDKLLYTSKMIDEMIACVDKMLEIYENLFFSFPVKAAFVANDEKENLLKKLISHRPEHHSLTIWGQTQLKNIEMFKQTFGNAAYIDVQLIEDKNKEK